MKTSCPKRRGSSFWCCFILIFFCINAAQSAIVDLTAYVSFALQDSSGNSLADGSVVMIFGSTDAINNGPQSYGTSLIAESVQGNDVYIGMVRIDWDGTFYTANDFSFDDSSIHFLYIRFFNTTNAPVEGSNIAWNASPVVGVTSKFGKAEVDFGGNYLASVTNNFVVIPEPATSHLFLLFFGLAFGMRSILKKDVSKQREPDGKGRP